MFIYLTHSPFSAKKGSFDEWIPVNLLHLSLPHLVLNLALQGSASQRSKEQKEFQGHLNKTASSHCSQPLISVSTEQTGLLGKRHRKWSFSVDYMFEKLGGKGRAEMVVYTCRQHWLKKKKVRWHSLLMWEDMLLVMGRWVTEELHKYVKKMLKRKTGSDLYSEGI